MELKKTLLTALISMALGVSASANAQQEQNAITALLSVDAEVENPTEALKRILAIKYPSTPFQSVEPTPIEGVYELVTGQKILYTDMQADYIIYGSIYDMAAGVDITAERTQEVMRTDMSPLDGTAIIDVRGDGSRTLHIFTDPDCPYCTKLEQTITALDNVTIKRYAFHLISGNPTLVNKIWCSGDNEARLAAYQAYLANKTAPQANLEQCSTTSEQIIEFARANGLASTPTMVSEDGRVLRGAVPLDQIESFLNQAKSE